MLWFVGLSAAATTLIDIFNWELVGVTHEMKQATVEATKSAASNAEAPALRSMRNVPMSWPMHKR
jgi:hypothetical protein